MIGMFITALLLSVGLSAQAEPTAVSASPRPQTEIKTLLKIAWTRGPNLPQGLQDGNVGIVNDTLIMAGGFCQGRKEPHKPDRYPRGFLNKAWGMNLSHRAEGWRRLPEYPGTPRQGLGAITVDNHVYYWGGFNYTSPFCYKDGYRLSARGDAWVWETMPEYPWRVCSVGLCAIGTTIYAFGGADYDENRFYTENDRAGKTPRMGARLNALDTTNLKAGWKPLPECPGTPRWVAAVAVVEGKIYVIGGATGDLVRDGKAVGYCTVVDNWVYDPATRAWSRLRDLPIGSGNFPPGDVVFQGRYIVLISGYQYAHIANPDGSVRTTYGKAGRFQNKGEYHNDVFVYDTKTNLFGRADSLPINNNAPMAIIRNDEVFILGGETGGGWVEGEYYGHHPDLLLVGRIALPK